VIFLFTDFGREGPYVGQMHAVLARQAPHVPVIDLMHDVQAHDPRAAAYLLAALAGDFPVGSVCCAVVDPGVGTARPPVVVDADGRWYVGPGNGLLALIRRRAAACRTHVIRWTPQRLSASFHGRDLFAPVAARLGVEGTLPRDWLSAAPGTLPGDDWPDDLAEVIYADRFGNLMSGLRVSAVDTAAALEVGGHRIRHARTFGDAPPGAPFWYGNSSGLVEIAMPSASAAAALGAGPGTKIAIAAPR
jgi:S-adenosyl-L-methionine hydrolase (adenosine-forming)